MPHCQWHHRKLPADKAAQLIFACNGAECWKSYKASHAAIQAGYTRVYWFRGGLPEWRSADRCGGTSVAVKSFREAISRLGVRGRRRSRRAPSGLRERSR